MFVEDGGIYLSSVIGEVDENLVIPDSIEYGGTIYPITKLGGCLYMYHNEIKKVTIPATVTFIGTGAFERCDNLKSVVFKDGIEDLSLYENSFWKTIYN